MGLKTTEYSKGEVKLGEWNNQHKKCLSKANNEHIPMITYWTPGANCSWCYDMEDKCFRDANFKKWQKSTPYIWCYTEGNNHEWKYDKFVNHGLTEYPFVWLHWKVSNTYSIDSWFIGRPDRMLDQTKNKYNRFKQSILLLFGQYIGK